MRERLRKIPEPIAGARVDFLCEQTQVIRVSEQSFESIPGLFDGATAKSEIFGSPKAADTECSLAGRFLGAIAV
jgi:hypothetical protein